MNLYMYNINTFASQRLIFHEKNEPFLLENVSNLTYQFLYDNFNKNICQLLFIQQNKEDDSAIPIQ